MKTLGTILLIVLYEAGTAIALPTPSEDPVFALSWIPAPWILLAAVAGRAVGAYLVFRLGDRWKQTERYDRWIARFDWLAALSRWSERFAGRFGAPVLFVLLAIPGLPDTAPLWIFALAGRRPVTHAIVAGAGAAARMLLVLLGVRLLLGPLTA